MSSLSYLTPLIVLTDLSLSVDRQVEFGKELSQRNRKFQSHHKNQFLVCISLPSLLNLSQVNHIRENKFQRQISNDRTRA